MFKKKNYLVVLITFLFSCTVPFFSPISVEAADDFQINAQAAMAIDVDTGKILYNQNGEAPLGIASITKILSMYIVLEQVNNGAINWDDRVPVSEYIASLSTVPDFSNVPLSAELTYSVKELYHAAMIESANAAVMALAEYIAGSESAFIDMMKAHLKDWNIQDAIILTSSGLSLFDIGTESITPENDQENMMSAKSVAVIAYHLIKDYPEVLEVSRTTSEVFAPGTITETVMTNWNWLLPGYLNTKEGVDGLKTGTTDFAGACFVGTINKEGSRLVTVVLNVDNAKQDAGVRFTETGRLMDYCYASWSKQEVPTAGLSVPKIAKLDVPEGKELSVSVVLKENVEMWTHQNMDLSNLIITPDLDPSVVSENTLDAPVTKGMTVGTATITLAEENLGYIGEVPTSSTEIVTTESVEEANFFEKMWRNIQSFFANLF